MHTNILDKSKNLGNFLLIFCIAGQDIAPEHIQDGEKR